VLEFYFGLISGSNTSMLELGWCVGVVLIYSSRPSGIFGKGRSLHIAALLIEKFIAVYSSLCLITDVRQAGLQLPNG